MAEILAPRIAGVGYGNKVNLSLCGAEIGVGGW
jgi:hypothetical protein